MKNKNTYTLQQLTHHPDFQTTHPNNYTTTYTTKNKNTYTKINYDNTTIQQQTPTKQITITPTMILQKYTLTITTQDNKNTDLLIEPDTLQDIKITITHTKTK